MIFFVFYINKLINIFYIGFYKKYIFLCKIHFIKDPHFQFPFKVITWII